VTIQKVDPFRYKECLSFCTLTYKKANNNHTSKQQWQWLNYRWNAEQICYFYLFAIIGFSKLLEIKWFGAKAA
jgi:hypothetical protein